MNERAYQVFRDLLPMLGVLLGALVGLGGSAFMQRSESRRQRQRLALDIGMREWEVRARNMAENAAAGYDSSIGSPAEFVYSAAKLIEAFEGGPPSDEDRAKMKGRGLHSMSKAK